MGLGQGHISGCHNRSRNNKPHLVLGVSFVPNTHKFAEHLMEIALLKIHITERGLFPHQSY
jgi:hypothetical protein